MREWDRTDWAYFCYGFITVVVLAIIILCIRPAYARYEAELTPAAKLSMADVYLEPVDPCDPIYQLIVQPTPDWTAKFYGSERSRIFFNLSQLNTVMVQLLQKVTALEARVKALEPIVDPNAVDPNGVKQ